MSLSGGYNTGFSCAADGAFVDQLNDRRGGSLSVGVSLPIFDRGSTALNTQRARLQAENERLAFDNSRQEVALQVRRAYLEMTTGGCEVTIARAGHVRPLIVVPQGGVRATIADGPLLVREESIGQVEVGTLVGHASAHFFGAMRAFVMTVAFAGSTEPFACCGPFVILSTTSMPEMTSPKIEYCPSSQGVSP